MTTSQDADTPSLPEGMIEERIQVNRRRLEHMIQALSNKQTDTGRVSVAEEFFDHVSKTTNSQVIWPSRLKIGAKTKKDPHVKIIGYPQNVDDAKKLIQGVLERKQNRVTIKLDVAFTDHSHIIGRNGHNTQSIMRETGCHIHFPDSNRDERAPKSNQVSIAGPLNQVERARKSLRQLAPLSVSFELSDFTGDVNRISNATPVRALTEQRNLQLMIRENRTTKLPFAVVKGNVSQADVLGSTVVAVQNFLFKKLVPVTLAMDICVAQQCEVLGPDGMNIAAISQLTGADILFPSSNARDNTATTFYVQGLIDQVLLARCYLMGLLPFSVQFDMPNSAVVPDPTLLNAWEQSMSVNIVLRPKRSGEGESVVIRGQERQLNTLYFARRYFVPSGEDNPTHVPDYDFMQNFIQPQMHGAVRYNIQSLQVQAPVYLPAGCGSDCSSVPLHSNGNGEMLSLTPYCTIIPALTPSPGSQSQPTTISASSSSSKEDAQPRTSQPLVMVVNNNSGEGKKKKPPPPLPPLPPEITSSSPDTGNPPPSSGYGSHGSRSNSVSSSTPLSAAPRPPAPPRPTLLAPHGIPGGVGESINSPGPITPVVTAFPACTDFIEPTEADLDPAVNPLASSMLRSAVTIQQEELEHDKWKIVGNGRDYQEMAKKASKAIKEFPNGPRTPNSQFSGFYFSKSMPASELAAKMKGMELAHEDIAEEDESGEQKPAEPKPAPRKFDPDSTGYFESLLGSQKSPRGKKFDPVSEDIEQLLTLLNLSQCIEIFCQEEISVSELLSLTEDDMKDLDLKFQHRRKLKCAIQKISQARKDGRGQIVYL